MESIQQQLLISAIINGFISLIILISCIILVSKKRTLATILLLLGSISTLISYIGGFIYTSWVATQQNAQYLLESQSLISFSQTLSFLLFGIGLLLLAINDFKKQ